MRNRQSHSNRLPQSLLRLHAEHSCDDSPLLDARRIALLPRGAQIVNVAGEQSIDAAALDAALTDGHIAGAYLAGIAADSPLRALRNVMCAPAL